MSEDPDKTVIKPLHSDPETDASDATVVPAAAQIKAAADAQSQLRTEPELDMQNTVVNPSIAIDDADKTRVLPVAEPARSDAEPIGVGSIINNRFVIDQLLGVGGMGVVHRALDKRKQEAKDRDPYVAIKILGKEFKDHPQAFVALQREARESQTLAHPNIITVYDFDRDGDNVYMTMEQLHGQTLEAFIKNHPHGTPAEVALPIIKAIARGLAYAHSKNIVHSDLKPGNVFISEDHDVKILDFGIARAVSAIGSEAGDKTLFDAQDLGGLTPSYASCEMFAGADPHPSDDVYALGLIAYELLTGLHPYFKTPAPTAVEKKLKPRRLKGIKGYQAKTLLASVELQRINRIVDAEEFLANFEKSHTLLAAISLTAVVMAGSFALYTILNPAELGPDVPFEQLTPQVQTRISSLLSDGYEALRFNDLNAALQLFNNAYDLHPRNPDIEAGLDATVEAFLDSQYPGSESEANAARLRDVVNMLRYSSLSDHTDLLELQNDLQN